MDNTIILSDDIKAERFDAIERLIQSTLRYLKNEPSSRFMQSIDVTFNKGSSYTNLKNKINIDGCAIERWNGYEAQALVIHEIGHIAYTPKLISKDGVIKDFYNVVEDVRINAFYIQKLSRNAHLFLELILNDNIKNVGLTSEKAFKDAFSKFDNKNLIAQGFWSILYQKCFNFDFLPKLEILKELFLKEIQKRSLKTCTWGDELEILLNNFSYDPQCVDGMVKAMRELFNLLNNSSQISTSQNPSNDKNGKGEQPTQTFINSDDLDHQSDGDYSDKNGKISISDERKYYGMTENISPKITHLLRKKEEVFLNEYEIKVACQAIRNIRTRKRNVSLTGSNAIFSEDEDFSQYKITDMPLFIKALKGFSKKLKISAKNGLKLRQKAISKVANGLLIKRPFEKKTFKEGGKTHVVIGFDTSGSMSDYFSLQWLKQSLVIIYKAFALWGKEIKVDIYLFNSHVFMLKEGKEKFDINQLKTIPKPDGSTAGIAFMTKATKTLLKSNAKRKIILAVTDGAWSPNKKEGLKKGIEQIIKSSGIETYGFLYCQGVSLHSIPLVTFDFDEIVTTTSSDDLLIALDFLLSRIWQEKKEVLKKIA